MSGNQRPCSELDEYRSGRWARSCCRRSRSSGRQSRCNLTMTASTTGHPLKPPIPASSHPESNGSSCGLFLVRATRHVISNRQVKPTQGSHCKQSWSPAALLKTTQLVDRLIFFRTDEFCRCATCCSSITTPLYLFLYPMPIQSVSNIRYFLAQLFYKSPGWQQ